jgi:hypothetical protein
VVAVDRARALADKEPDLALVADKLPASPETLQAATDASDAVILHLWRATQFVTDVSPARRVSGRWWLTRTTVSTCAACTTLRRMVRPISARYSTAVNHLPSCAYCR